MISPILSHRSYPSTTRRRAPIPDVADCLDDVHYPQNNRWNFPVVKAALAAALADYRTAVPTK
jgi:hypothetical protein